MEPSTALELAYQAATSSFKARLYYSLQQFLSYLLVHTKMETSPSAMLSWRRRESSVFGSYHYCFYIILWQHHLVQPVTVFVAHTG